MNRPILVCTLFVAVTAALGAQDASQSNAYQGTSNPPADDQITTSGTPAAKPPAGRLESIEPATPAPRRVEPRPASVDPSLNDPAPGNDGDVMRRQNSAPASPERTYVSDPDGDIVHLHARRPGELVAGTVIRVRLLERLSSTDSERGETFRTRVASDVMQNGQVLIPAGAEIDGRVAQVSTGRMGGHGSMRLSPETVILPDGKRYRLHAEISGTPGARAHVAGEGTINPGSRMRRDEVEYGGAVGAGVVTGAVIAGPVGAVTGGLIGAGAITVHLLVSHPQATLDEGTAMLFTLTEPLDLVPAEAESEN